MPRIMLDTVRHCNGLFRGCFVEKGANGFGAEKKDSLAVIFRQKSSQDEIWDDSGGGTGQVSETQRQNMS